MKKLCAVAAIVECVTGLALMVSPSFVTKLLLGGDVLGVGIVLGRLAGLGLFGLGLAWWSARDTIVGKTPMVRAILAYNLFVALYLLVIGIDGESVGIMLWPAFAFHGLLALILARAWLVLSAPPRVL